MARVQWDSVGAGFTYNLYSSSSEDLSNPHKETDAPTPLIAVDWIADNRPKEAWIAVTAVNSKGAESFHSDPVPVVFEKPSGKSQALKETAKTLKGLIPWTR